MAVFSQMLSNKAFRSRFSFPQQLGYYQASAVPVCAFYHCVSCICMYVLWTFNQPVKVLGAELLFFSFDPRGTVSCLLILWLKTTGQPDLWTSLFSLGFYATVFALCRKINLQMTYLQVPVHVNVGIKGKLR